MSHINIEQITSAEVLTGCANILVQAYNAEPWKDEWTQEKALEKLMCFFRSPKFIGFVAYSDDQIVGACVGNIEPYYTGDYFYLKEIFVPGQRQKQGIGKLMMQTLREHLLELDVKQIILFTSKDHFPFGFYLRSGFNTMEEMRMMHFGNDGEGVTE